MTTYGGNWKDLLKASHDGDLSLIRFHLRDGKVDPNYQHPEYFTSPVFEAIRGGHIDAVQLFIDHASSSSSTGDDASILTTTITHPEELSGKTPLEVAIEHRRHDIVDLLLSTYMTMTHNSNTGGQQQQEQLYKGDHITPYFRHVVVLVVVVDTGNSLGRGGGGELPDGNGSSTWSVGSSVSTTSLFATTIVHDIARDLLEAGHQVTIALKAAAAEVDGADGHRRDSKSFRALSSKLRTFWKTMEQTLREETGNKKIFLQFVVNDDEEEDAEAPSSEKTGHAFSSSSSHQSYPVFRSEDVDTVLYFDTKMTASTAIGRCRRPDREKLTIKTKTKPLLEDVVVVINDDDDDLRQKVGIDKIRGSGSSSSCYGPRVVIIVDPCSGKSADGDEHEEELYSSSIFNGIHLDRNCVTKWRAVRLVDTNTTPPSSNWWGDWMTSFLALIPWSARHPRKRRQQEQSFVRTVVSMAASQVDEGDDDDENEVVRSICSPSEKNKVIIKVHPYDHAQLYHDNARMMKLERCRKNKHNGGDDNFYSDFF